MFVVVLFQISWNVVPYHLESPSNLSGTSFQLIWNNAEVDKA